MSDISQGPGWWQASDGKWYPPEQAPGGQPAAAQAPTGQPPMGEQPQGQPAYGAPAVATPGPLASWGERVIAYLIDAAFIIVGYIALFIVYAILGVISDALALLVLVVGYVALLAAWLYFAYLAGQVGGSPGMRLTGLKLVSEANGQTIGGAQGIVRQIVAWAINFFTCGLGGIVDYLFPLWDEKNQTLHDKVIKTVVLKDQAKMELGVDLLKP